MSQVMINTPLPIQVGDKIYKLITFEDLYTMCLKDSDLFKAILAAHADLGSILAGKGLVLPEKCLKGLVELLSDPKLGRLAQDYVDQHWQWPQDLLWAGRGGGGEHCTWPNCP